MWIYWTNPNSTNATYESLTTTISTSSVLKLVTENLHTVKWYNGDTLLKTKSTNTSYPLVPSFKSNNSYPMTIDYVKIKLL